MRLTLGSIGILGMLLLPAPPPQAQTPPAEYTARLSGGATIEVRGDLDVATAPSAGAASSVSTRGAPVFYGARYRISSDQGQPCIDLSVDAFADQAAADAANNAVNVGLDYLRPSYGGLCPSAAADPAVAALLPTPEQVALSFLQDFTLPAPQPEIAPGWALTGKTAYLTSNAQPTAAAGYATVLGPLTFDARSAHLSVDWGDGRGPIRYDSLGGPWPDGDVSTVYGDAGAVTVQVVQHWTLTWNVGGAGGEIDGMTSTATIPDLEIRQLQAVIG